MFNPVIIIALIAQGAIKKASRIGGAIAGYVITTGILVWGLSLYQEGYQIAFCGVPLSQPIFLLACLVWYGFDTKEFIEAKKEPQRQVESQVQVNEESTEKMK